MAELKKKSRRKKAKKRERIERRFLGSQTQSTRTAAIAGMVGAGGLGAGVYAQWIRDPALPYGPYIVAGGAFVLGAALWFGDSGGLPVRVGDTGVAIEKGTEIVRLSWCDMERIYVDGSKLILKGDGLELALPLAAHRAAAAWILKEGVKRVPEAMDVNRRHVDGLPEPKESDGELVPATEVQVAGRRCASSDKIITFEGDARLCPTCGQVYHKDHVPRRCATCDDDIAGRAFRP